jgi:type IV fimbrial biogenesis protein FimT
VTDKRSVMSGFTIIELMVTLAVLLTIIVLAVPSFSVMITQNRISADVNSLVATLSLARSMAVTGTAPATICSDNGGACGTATDWAKGGLLFSDTDSSQTLNGTETIKRRVDATDNITVLSNVAAVTFNRDGSTKLPAGTTSFRWVFCDPNSRVDPRQVTVLGNGSNFLFKPSACSL